MRKLFYLFIFWFKFGILRFEHFPSSARINSSYVAEKLSGVKATFNRLWLKLSVFENEIKT
ncbi:hypothetical protein BpHYR1_022146 [Brachionus plicatilis]|uniref:Uncharacterized protein n=1 Tax=Brachionus plicatilis TaxID=10195 RepID=A0A3M7P798_BRAPC|nr:hypothetical protein BpHYR1_022146 [Brachionus plicatilis]